MKTVVILAWLILSFLAIFFGYQYTHFQWDNVLSIEKAQGLIKLAPINIEESPDLETEQPKLIISWNCDINNTSYQVLDIWSWNIITPSVKELNRYAKSIYISWYIEEAYICVIANVREDYKRYQ
jgi:hypothetical protein